MNVHIFGKNNSSFIANFFLKQSRKDQQNEFLKVITELVNKDFYIDEFLKSGECVKDLIRKLHNYYSYYSINVSD